jgi:hypothetical protein
MPAIRKKASRLKLQFVANSDHSIHAGLGASGRPRLTAATGWHSAPIFNAKKTPRPVGMQEAC